MQYRAVLGWLACASLALGCTAGRSTRDSGVHTMPDTDGSVVTRRDADIPIGCVSYGSASNPDQDGDGWNSGDGDCDDCSNVVNPGAYDFPGNDNDEDCDGSDAPETETACGSLAIDSTDAEDAARALGLCTFTDEASRRWGVISARFTRADGGGGMDSPLQTGILTDFGSISPPRGDYMLALSSGIARAPNQPDYTSECDIFGVAGFLGLPEPPPSTPFPSGFPVESPDCPSVTTGPVFNAAALELRIRVPTNASSLYFRSNFYTYEYPDYICSEYNDFFVALLTPRPAGLANDNIVFDSDNNLVSVNTSLLQVCQAGNHGGRNFACPLGTAQLSGTGFDGTATCGTADVFGLGGGGQASRAATGWLRTTAPVARGQIITVRFTVWDSGDPDLDSTVLIDDFGWEIEEAPVRTIPDLI